jgi:hypothetical protein
MAAVYKIVYNIVYSGAFKIIYYTARYIQDAYKIASR